jgi:hypothetical protein
VPGSVGRLVTEAERSARRSDETSERPFAGEVLRSAFPISDRHILTALHCVEGLRSLWLRLPVAGVRPSFVYIPVVMESSRPVLDVAVVTIDHSRLSAVDLDEAGARRLLGAAALRLGTSVRRGATVWVEGFPVDRSASNTTTLTGRVESVSDIHAGAPFLLLGVPAFAAYTPDDPRGMSGGPVLVDGSDGETAVGVLVKVPVARAGGKALGGTVVAAPIAQLLDVLEISTALAPPSRRGLSRRWVIALCAGVTAAAGTGVAALLAGRPAAHSGARATTTGTGSTSAGPLRTARPAGIGSVVPAADLDAGGGRRLWAVDFARSATGLLACGGDAATIELWRLGGGAARAATISAGAPVTCLAFQPAGTLLASGHERGIQLWETASPATPHPSLSAMQGANFGPVVRVAWSPDGRTVASAHQNRFVALWDASAPGELDPVTSKVEHLDEVTGVAFSPVAGTLASCGWDGLIILWRLTGQSGLERVATLGPGYGSLLCAAYSPDGGYLVSGGVDGNLRFWSVADSGHASSVGAHSIGPKVLAVAYSRDWLVAAACEDATVHLFDASDPAGPVEIGRAPLRGFTQPVQSTAFSADAGLVAGAGADGSVRVWRLG